MSNKDRFMELLDHIERKGYRKELLIKQLEISDFLLHLQQHPIIMHMRVVL